MVVRRQILRLSSHCSAFTLSNIRHFTPLRMTKCAAKYKSWRCYELVCQSLVTSHLRLLIPSYSSLLSNFWGGSHSSHRHPERSRGIFLALRSVSHKHWQGNDVVATCFCVHIGIVCRSARKISRCARNDDTGVRGLLVTSHQSQVPSH